LKHGQGRTYSIYEGEYLSELTKWLQDISLIVGGEMLKEGSWEEDRLYSF
jgi:hypothetical protein